MGVQFLREHVIQEARIHYAITNTGGYSPNVVQPEAEVLYLIRAPKNAQVQEIYARVNKIAQGAAMMTETDLTIDFYKACSNLIPNTVMEELIYKNLCEAGLRNTPTLTGNLPVRSGRASRTRATPWQPCWTRPPIPLRRSSTGSIWAIRSTISSCPITLRSWQWLVPPMWAM